MDLARVAITFLTVIAFALSAWGIIGAMASTTAHARSVNNERRLRSLYRSMSRRYRDEAERLEDLGERENARRLRDGAARAWEDRHAEVGLEPWSYQSLTEGREFLAESLLDELVRGTRHDALLVGVGLLAGLVASVWSIWLDT